MVEVGGFAADGRFIRSQHGRVVSVSENHRYVEVELMNDNATTAVVRMPISAIRRTA
jgi:hypothetical protein